MILFFGVWLLYGVKPDSAKSKEFATVKTDFLIINEMINELLEASDEETVYLYFEPNDEGKITEVSMDLKTISLTEKQFTALNNIQKVFRYELSHIEANSKRISYGGIGYDMYVFSKDGRTPAYFYSPEDKNVKFKTYGLGDDWYYLLLSSR